MPQFPHLQIEQNHLNSLSYVLGHSVCVCVCVWLWVCVWGHMYTCVYGGCTHVVFHVSSESRVLFFSAFCLPLWTEVFSSRDTILHGHKPLGFAALSLSQAVSDTVTRTQSQLESLLSWGLAGHPCIMGGVCMRGWGSLGRRESPFLIASCTACSSWVLRSPACSHLRPSALAVDTASISHCCWGLSFSSGSCGAHRKQPDSPLRRR